MAEDTPGREPVLLVEIDQDQCNLTYGTAPCAAILGTTGDHKCFNSRITCQDPDNYDRGTLSVRFCRAQAEVPFSWGAIPSLVSAETVPTVINPGGGDRNRGPLGSRASIRVQFQDHPHSDFQVDKYRSERLSGAAQASGVGYDPLQRASFWTKWLSRNPYWLNRQIRIREGYIDQDPSAMVTRHYFIKDITGPDSNGRVTVKAEDVLRLADRENAQAPKKSEGVLYEGISAGSSTLTIVNYRDVDDYPPGSGTVRIGDEVLTYSGKSIDTENNRITLSGLTRGTDRTNADSHDAEDNVQLCLRYTNENCWVVARELLEDYANVPASFVPFADWQSEGHQWLRTFTVTALITEPEGVQDLLSQLTEQCLFFIWWDEREQEIKLAAFRPPFEDVVEIDDYSHIKADSWGYETDMDQRISEVWVYYGVRDPTGDIDEPTNYSTVRVRVDPDFASDDRYGQTQVRQIFARWLEGAAQALVLGARLLQRYKDGARYMSVTLDAKDRSIWTGDSVLATNRGNVDFTGQEEQLLWQVLSAEETQPGESVQYRMMRFEFDGRYAQWMPNDAPVYGDASDLEKTAGGFWAYNDGSNFPDGTEPYRFI